MGEGLKLLKKTVIRMIFERSLNVNASLCCSKTNVFFSLFIDIKRLNGAKDISLHDYNEIVHFLKKNCASEKTWLSSNSSHAIVSAIKEVRNFIDLIIKKHLPLKSIQLIAASLYIIKLLKSKTMMGLSPQFLNNNVAFKERLNPNFGPFNFELNKK